ncbi:MAG TPA: flavodoxin-dependent (E)-4-hydroxy-3-methylbut-2-enyl-diphosphate synthase [Dehalococcoidia bacterium]|nr:flavodoxin-dependent (E)-4-hydroxy-3-methylbut-2-enyl-diphosphate synthase [Dehalococcoidia bacterium]
MTVEENAPLSPRRKTRPVHVGDIQVGGDAPVVVQTMTNTDTADAKSTLEQTARLAEAGAEIVRVAVPDKAAAAALPEIVRGTPVPLIADIHFDYRLALASIEAGIHGLRLNPGNIRDADKVREVVRAAKERGIPIRVGVNEGSLPPLPPLADGELPPPKPQRMVDAALWEIGVLEEMGFEDIKISLKAFDVPTMVTAYREIAKRVPYPLHLGVTEAGTPGAGSVRSAVGIGLLLAEGIGDTIRVSLAADPVEELPVAWNILGSLNIRQRGATIVACPTCGRIEVDLIPLANQVEAHFQKLGKPITVAVMGCVVNGPGESRDADIGLAAGKGKGAIFRKGEVVRIVPEEQFLSALIEEGRQVIAERFGEAPPAPKADELDAVIPMTVVDSAATRPGRASRR